MSGVVVMGLGTVGGLVVLVWTLIDGRTTVGKGLTRRTITRAQEPWTFFFHLLRLGLFTVVLAAGTVWLWLRGPNG